GEGGGGIDDGRGADGEENLRMVSRLDGVVQSLLRQLLAEPNDIVPQRARAIGANGRPFYGLILRFDDFIFIRAAKPMEVSVNFNHVFRARRLMKTVDIMGDQSEVGDFPLHLGQSKMGRVRFSLKEKLSLLRMPAPHLVGILGEGFGGG